MNCRKVSLLLSLLTSLSQAVPALSVDTLQVGAAEALLEASDDMVIAGGIGPGKATGQEGKLRVTATVLDLGGTRLAIVSCDIIAIRRNYLDPAVNTIEKEIGIPAANILINSSHTHHAPSTLTVHGYKHEEVFCGRVRDAIVEAVRRADARRRESGPCRLRFRLGQESSVGQNSRLLLGDGTVFWVGNRDDEVRPTGPFDPELPVLAFEREDGKLESLIFNHSTHLIGTLRPGVRSPGFYGLSSQNLEKELGTTVTFISGAYGSTHNLTLECKEMIQRIEASVRAALAKTNPMKVTTLRAIKRQFKYRVRHFDEKVQDAAVSSYCHKRLGGSPAYIVDVFRKMRKTLTPHQGEERTTWLQVLRVGDIAWAGIPGELFTSLGLEIKRRSPFRYTYIAGTTNDYIGYLGDAEAYELGGYQLWTGLHSLVEKGTGEAIVDAAVKMLEEL